MTGNNKVWRASLAGLASVAMLATMGVVAGTANAAVTPDVDDPTITFDYGKGTVTSTAPKSVNVFYGDSLIDALKGNLAAPTAPADNYFIGYYGEDGQPFDFTAPLTQDTKVVAKYAEDQDVVKVEFQGDYGFYPLGGATGYVLKGATLDARQAPTDKADGQLTATWSVEGAGVDTTKITDGTVDSLSKVAVTRPEGNTVATVTVAPKTFESGVKTLRFNGNSNVTTTDAVKTGSYALNAFADGKGADNDDDDLLVDTTEDTYKAPSIITLTGTLSDGNKVQAYSAWINQPGTKHSTKVGEDIANVKNGDTFEIDPASVVTYVLVTFDSKGGTTVPAQRVFLDQKDEAGNAYGFAEEPTAPTKDGYVFKGWQNKWGFINWKAAPTEDLSPRVTGDTTLTAVWEATTSELKVTFRDADYNGKHADVPVKVAGNDFVSEDQAPDWDRDGYVLTGWQYNGADFDFDAKVAADVNGGNDFVLTAVYRQVDEDAVVSALNYVNDGSSIGREGTVVEGGVTNNKALFNEASFKEFKTVWTKVNKEYQQAQFAAQSDNKGDKISKETSTNLVKQLAEAWPKLVFTAQDYDSVDYATTSYRFYNHVTNEHLFTANETEANILKSNPDWNYEPDGNFRVLWSQQWNGAFEDLASFKGSDEVKAQLKAVAKPLTVKVQRLYNRITNEHLFTTNQAEVDKLSAGDWTLEPANAFYAPSPASSSQKSVYRLYNPILNQHLFTPNPVEVEQTTAGDWKLEGVEFKAL